MKISHPNVLRHFNVFKHGDRNYFITEYSECGDLFQMLQVTNSKGQRVWRPLCEEDSRHLIKGIAQGLKHLHSIPMAHGDLKLPNVLLFRAQKTKNLSRRTDLASEAGFEEFVPKLADFGQSRIIGTEPTAKDDLSNRIMTLRQMCCLHYAAPESCAATKCYDMVIADCFSLGICLLAMLLGAHPYANLEDLLEDVDQDIDAFAKRESEYIEELNKAKTDPLLIDELCAHFSPLLRQALVCLLDANPETRMTASEFLSHMWINPRPTN